MKENYCSFEQAVKLKELGFDERTTYEYSEIVEGSGREEWDEDEQRMMFIEDINYYPKLRLDQAQKWLREVKHIYVYPEINCLKKWFAKAVNMERNEDLIWEGTMFDTYELALSAGIDAALELLTDKLNGK